MGKTSLVIPIYSTTEKSIEMAERCLDSLKYGRPDEVIVVDDGSPLEHHYECDRLIRLTYNQGYTVAVNTGLKASTGDIIIIGNSDLTFTPGWLEGILKPLQEGCDVSSIVTSDQGYLTKDEITIGNRFGSLWAMKREVYEDIGSLDESLGRGYFSDAAYYMELRAKNYRVGKNWAALVEHEGGSTFKAVDPDYKSYYESMKRFKRKYGLII